MGIIEIQPWFNQKVGDSSLLCLSLPLNFKYSLYDTIIVPAG